jgi:histidinol-phosphate/aromatic aminotransferase/cobyric acid decarboxylase-like protein
MNPNNLPAIVPGRRRRPRCLDLPYMRATCALIASHPAPGPRTALPAAGIAVTDSFANFLLLDVKTAEDAAAADAHLRAEGHLPASPSPARACRSACA